jgi:mannose-6-phosphate isomerase
MSMMYPLKLIPAFKDYLWGGTRLAEEYGKNTPLRPVAEAWELSCHPDGPSVAANGFLAGQTLTAVLASYPTWSGETIPGDGFPKEFPILVKLIDAAADLSLQVHPDDDFARRVEGQQGKNEMWYIIDREPGAKIILGFREPISPDKMRESIADNTILNLVNAIEVEPGDCYCIPAGMLHAIGGGILVAEVQQSSNITYRVYDYDRKGADGQPRPLHIDKAVAVTNSALTAAKSAFGAEAREGCTVEKLCDWRYFSAYRCTIDGQARLCAGDESFHGILCLEGSLALKWAGDKLPLAKGETVFVPAGLGEYVLAGRGSALIVHSS